MRLQDLAIGFGEIVDIAFADDIAIVIRGECGARVLIELRKEKCLKSSQLETKRKTSAASEKVDTGVLGLRHRIEGGERMYSFQ
jgi:hypothetical protein